MTTDTIPTRSLIVGADLAKHQIRDRIAWTTIRAGATTDEEHLGLDDAQSQITHQLLRIEGVDAAVVFHERPDGWAFVMIGADRSELTRALMDDYHFARGISLTPEGDLVMSLSSSHVDNGRVSAKTVREILGVIRAVADRTTRHPENRAEIAVIAAAMKRTQLLIGNLAVTTIRETDVPAGTQLRDVAALPELAAEQIEQAEPGGAAAVVVFHESPTAPRMAIYTHITDLAERIQEIVDDARALTVTDGDMLRYGEGKGEGRIIVGCKSNKELAALRDASMPKVIDAAVEHERKCAAALEQARARGARGPARAVTLAR
jgi:hypothetical protein